MTPVQAKIHFYEIRTSMASFALVAKLFHSKSLQEIQCEAQRVATSLNTPW